MFSTKSSREQRAPADEMTEADKRKAECKKVKKQCAQFDSSVVQPNNDSLVDRCLWLTLSLQKQVLAR